MSRGSFLGLGAAGSVGLLLGCGTRREPRVTADYHERFRPQLRFSPKENWTNDPDGPVYHDGEYHLFFQHNPRRDTRGNVSWGHAVSRDLLRWEELAVAPRPDDLGLIFPGSAVADGRGGAAGLPGGVPPGEHPGLKTHARTTRALPVLFCPAERQAPWGRRATRGGWPWSAAPSDPDPFEGLLAFIGWPSIGSVGAVRPLSPRTGPSTRCSLGRV